MANKPSAKRFTPKPTADDRNLVEISSDSNAISFEDRVYLWWKKNARRVYLLLIVLVAAIAVWFIAQWNQQAREVTIQQEYQAAQTPEQQEEFTQRYPGHSLSGVIWKTRGDEAFQSKDYALAAEYLGKAAPVLDGITSWYARLGLGASLLQAGQSAEGIKVLEELGYSPEIPASFRAQAFWQLAIHYWAEGDYTKLETNLEQVQDMDIDGVFIQEIQSIRSMLPSNR